MNLEDVSNIRLVNQQIESGSFKQAKDLVSWMGAMQAQDYAMATWGIGLRLPEAREKLIQEEIDSGAILRTHLLRPTWHLVSADDIWWMLELTAAQVRIKSGSRLKELGIDAGVCLKSNHVIESAFAKQQYLTREELYFEMEQNKVGGDKDRWSHLIFLAELEGILCSGIKRDKNQTYAILGDRVPRPVSIGRDEALAKLAFRYFSSHCPASLNDFIWWSGLPITAAKRALEMIKPGFISETIAGQEFWFPENFSRSAPASSSVHLLPAFDEFLISYKDRTAAFPLTHHAKAFTNNGIFHPVIVVGGQVKGIWKRTIKKNKVSFEAQFFQAVSAEVLDLTKKTALKFAAFLDKEIEYIKPA
ncbi:winged helix DNA-binding domain-containing protein [Pedobacter sp. KBW06]|uniref:winged helix DNA-binding domain-containing protein n=1 Tax=Pedobacter sp. KBW06 TaxID=2153359 RepID=UPI000F5A7528|nr:winged helix DNA-binding domain-containing protein [Pedobacter sp. KBW06]RQO75393.1 winged helix DNA-binding domain-containing protein [Pedobacter sp. KBW06]